MVMVWVWMLGRNDNMGVPAVVRCVRISEMGQKEVQMEKEKKRR